MELGTVTAISDPAPFEESILLTRARTPRPVQQPLVVRGREPEPVENVRAPSEQGSPVPGPPEAELVVPVAAALTAPPERGPVPPEVVLAALAVFGLGAALLYPVLRYGGELVLGLFQGGLSRALASVVLSVLVLLATYGVALCVVAVQLVRGSRVARGTTCLFVGAVTIGAAVVGFPTTQGAGGPSALGFVVAGAGLAVLALLTLPSGARRFFSGRAQEPVAVLAAATVAVYMGINLIGAGALLLPAVPLDGHLLLWAPLLMGGGAGLLWANRGLKDGSKGARVLVSLVFFAYAIICLVIGHGSVSIAAVIATTVAVGMSVALWIDPASVAHFSGRPVSNDTPPQWLGVIALVGSLLVGGVLLAVAHQQDGAVAQASTTVSALDASTARTVASTPPSRTHNQPTTYSAAPTTAPPSGREISPSALGTVWEATETVSGGSSVGQRIAAGVPVRYADGFTFGTLVAGSAYSELPVSVRVTLTNATPGFAVGASFTLGLGSGWGDHQAEVQHRDEPTCSGSAGVGARVVGLLASSPTTSSSTLMVLHGCYSPCYTNSDPQVLAMAAAYIEEGGYTAEDGSTSATFTTGAVTSPGVAAGSAKSLSGAG